MPLAMFPLIYLLKNMPGVNLPFSILPYSPFFAPFPSLFERSTCSVMENIQN